jgi:hypothetical protein
MLAIACLITYLLVTRVLSLLYFISKDDDSLGGMWAVIATIFVIRLIYLVFLPFHSWATVVMVVAAVSPQHAWQQPILRFADTIVGVAVGIAAAWISLRVIRPGSRQPGDLAQPAAAMVRKCSGNSRCSFGATFSLAKGWWLILRSRQTQRTRWMKVP